MSKIQITWSKLLPLSSEGVSKLEEVGGVYRISKKSDDGKYYVFYVGSTDNLKNTLLNHLSEDEQNVRLKEFIKLGGDLKFKYAIIPEESTRKAIEKQMYRTYLPELNTEEPVSQLDLEANLS